MHCLCLTYLFELVLHAVSLLQLQVLLPLLQPPIRLSPPSHLFHTSLTPPSPWDSNPPILYYPLPPNTFCSSCLYSSGISGCVCVVGARVVVVGVVVVVGGRGDGGGGMGCSGGAAFCLTF
jgi:hypothetical protein